MEFSHQDVRRIYGKTFFMVGSDGMVDEKKEEVEVVDKEEPKADVPVETPSVKPTPPEINPLEKFLGTGPTSNWKLKPNSTLALIVLKSEFKDREAMANLKNLVVAAGIDTSRIGFGIVEDGQQGWNFSDMPVGMGIMFVNFSEKLPSPATWKNKLFYPAAPLAMIMKDERYAKAMDRLLKRVQADMEQ